MTIQPTVHGEAENRSAQDEHGAAGSTNPAGLGATQTVRAARALAVLRISTGFIFLWAFLDKTFGLNYSTTFAKSWINGGSPTNGFLSHVAVGPFQSGFQSIAGLWWTNLLFMLGLLGVGVALIAGVGIRVAAIAGAAMMAMMWLADYPLARFTSAGEATGSTNPLVDYHLLYAVVLIVLALTYSGSTWGWGRAWARTSFVRRHPWAR